MKMRMHWFIFALALLIGMQCAEHKVFADDIQYLGFFVGTIDTEPYFTEGFPDTYNQDGFKEVSDAIGTRGTSKRKPALFFTLNFFRQSVDKHGIGSILRSSVRRLLGSPDLPKDKAGEYTTSAMKLALENILAASLATDMPVIIRLDGKEWWELRPDLWNWWDENEVGYNPDNINNVERFDWGTSTGTAVKIGWRNWGSQLRIPPAPNTSSPKYREEQKKCLDLLLPVIAKWYKDLASDKKYLFGGLMFGWELSVYANNFYYPNGNDYLAQDPANDPQSGVSWLPLGYAAAQTMGLQDGKGQITTATRDEISVDYLDFLIGLAVEHGIPENLITTHIFPPHPFGYSGQSGKAAVSKKFKGVIPGWSWHGPSRGLRATGYSADMSLQGFDSVIDYANGGPWSLSETASGISYSGSDTIGVYKTAAEVQECLEEVFAYRNNRYIILVNWGGMYPGEHNNGVKYQPILLEGIRLTLWEDPSVSVGAQSGSLSAGTAGSATFPLTATGNIAIGTAITLNNISSVAGVTLGTAATEGNSTALTVGTTADTPEGEHPLTVTIGGLTSNIFSLVVTKGSLEEVKYYPNPIQPSKGLNYAKMTFSNMPAGTRIKIYTMLGQVVRELKADASGTAVWDGKNNAGEKAASGMYIVYMEDGNGNKKRIKVAVER